MKERGTISAVWLAARQANPNATVRLFCFPYAGGSEAVFRGWQEGLPDTIEVCPVQLPGRGARVKEQPFTDLSRLVEAASVGLISHLDKPFAIFGHSMGAIIAFELARRLRREYGQEPIHLFVSARCSPQTFIGRPALRLSDSEFTAVLRGSEATPKEVLDDPELIGLLLPVLRADFAVGQPDGLSSGPLLSCPITAFGGIADPTTMRSCMEGWREHTSSRFMLRMLPGRHFFINTEKSLILSAIARELHQHIMAIQQQKEWRR